MTAGYCFCDPETSSPTLDPTQRGVVVLPVGKPWVRTAAPLSVQRGVARGHTAGRLAAALEGKARIVGSGGVLAVLYLNYHLLGLGLPPPLRPPPGVLLQEEHCRSPLLLTRWMALTA